MQRKLYVTIFMLCAFASAYAQQLVKGKIYDAITHEPLSGANVFIPNTTKGAQTNAQGTFKFSVDDNTTKITVSLLGYQTVTIAIENKELSIALNPFAANMQEVVVTASRESQLRSQAPIAISKISAKLLEETKPTAVYEVMNKVSGVLMVNLNNEQHSMSIRQPMTTSGYYLYMEDGIGIRPMGVFNHNSLLEVNQYAISSIEVVKGPVSSIYGPEAVGGAVNFITQRPTAVPTARVGIQFDQWGYKRLQFGAGTQIGKFGVYVGGLSSQQKGSWMTYSNYDKTSINTRLEYQLSAKTQLTGTFMYGDYYSQTSGSVDSTAFFNRSYTSNNEFTYRKSKASRSRITLEHDWSKGSKSFITLFNRFNEHGQNPSYGIKWKPGQTTAAGEINSNNFTSYGIIGQHSQRFGFLNSKLIAGGLFDYSPNDYSAYQVDLSAQLRPDGKSVEKYTIIKERPDIKLSDYTAKIRNAAAYMQYDFEPLKNLRFSTGLRYDLMSFTYDNYLDASAGSKEYERITPKVGLTYDLGHDKGLYANYSQGFAPPALTAIFRKKPNSNPAEFYYNLKPALFQNYEVGAWAAFLQNKVYVDVAIYRMDGQNELLNIRQPDNSYDYQSAGKTLHKGIEFSTTIKPVKELSFRLGGTCAIHRFEDFQVSNKEGDQLKNLNGYDMPSSPRWVWNTELNYYPQWFKNFHTSMEWQHVSGWYQNQINMVSYSGYDLLNARVGYQWRGIEVYSNLMNLTDALYASNASRGNNITDRTTYTAAAPRTLVLGITYQLAKK
ncbi:TonB-dependent receptor [Solitalea sp. MAHUQ-68]|uniref:TonB-dependent receptor n=1 Tax=Solitalea agri TaxID=2953739 RepID=A0A9X2F382_9SPHI|nr:TonB-dependent receptor [Solitalea agri]MCO4293912.1 TonB-dependent receptor [Solitalea agri]